MLYDISLNILNYSSKVEKQSFAIGGKNITEGAIISWPKSMTLLPPGNSIMGAIISRYTGMDEKERKAIK